MEAGIEGGVGDGGVGAGWGADGRGVEMQLAGGVGGEAGFDAGECGRAELRWSGWRECGVDDGGEVDGVAVLLQQAVDADVVLAEGAGAEDDDLER